MGALGEALPLRGLAAKPYLRSSWKCLYKSQNCFPVRFEKAMQDPLSGKRKLLRRGHQCADSIGFTLNRFSWLWAICSVNMAFVSTWHATKCKINIPDPGGVLGGIILLSYKYIVVSFPFVPAGRKGKEKTRMAPDGPILSLEQWRGK